ncbi:hypothetical protein QMK17_17345 [Rhodococcus sp. G-MC3]|uniref:hypothetical protein n=1 Tax=Rhodococcus sp. G-MC3 TaxID=3046209 RepID=UPI0024BB4306|nr:hypothetical protein [Rhodococcus sp. G-MC3]MDJ0395092.1 hypothetical protein [Rhodococcus sp. G-MC3]
MASTSNPAFPSDRAQRTTLLTGSAPKDRANFWTLSEHIAYTDIRSIVADYINTTISDPANTQRHHWAVEALPSTDAPPNERRLLTLTCGALETLFVTEFTNDEDDSIELEMTVNTALSEDYSGSQLDIATDVVTAAKGIYASHDVWSWRIDLGALLTDDSEVDFGIGDDLFDDLAYSLNSTLMAERPDVADHSEDLASDLVAEAYRQLRDSELDDSEQKG